MKAFRTQIIRSITHSFSRFWAIFAIVALGAGFFAGLRATAPDMRATGDAYYDSGNMMDLHIISTMGLTEQDTDAVRTVKGVQAAEPAYSADIISRFAGMDQVIRVHSIPSGGPDGTSMNRPRLLSGRWPQNAGECVVGAKRANLSTVKIGDTVTVGTQNGSRHDLLKYGSFRIVGVVSSSYYISFNLGTTEIGNGDLNYFMYIRKEDFDSPVYTDLFATVQGAAQQDSFSAQYTDTVSPVADAVKAISSAREKARYDEIYSEAAKKLADGKSEYEKNKADADQKLADAAKKLSDGEKKLDASERKLEDSERRTAQGETALTEGEQKSADAQKQYEDGLKKWRDGQKTLEENRKKYDDGVRELQRAEQEYNDSMGSYLTQKVAAESQMEQAQKKLDSGWKQIDKSAEKLDHAETELNASKKQLDDAKTQLDSLQTYLSLLRINPQALVAAGQLSPEIAGSPAALNEYISNTQQQYDSGKTQYDSGLKQYESGYRKYRDGKEQLDRAEDKLERGQRELDRSRESARTQFAEAEEKLKKGAEQLAQAKTANQPKLDDAKKQLESGTAQLEETRVKLDQAKADLAKGRAELDVNRAKLADARKKIASGKKELAKAKNELAKGKADYETSRAEATQKLSDAAKKLSEGETDLKKLKQPQWYVLKRDTNPGYVSFRDDTDRMDSIATVFPLIFFMVAALVALTTMTRMVEEERIQIGTYKALGFSNGKIALKYLIYAAAASISGSIAGIIVGMVVLPQVVWQAYSILYSAPAFRMLPNLGYALLSLCAAVGCTLIATYASCRAELAEVPASLMLPRAPKAGQRILLEYITPLWSRLNFTQKVTARNLLRYKKRFFMTVIGIAGCTALLVTGFGLKDSVSQILTKQFLEIDHYNATVGLKSHEIKPGLISLLNDGHNFRSWMKASSKSADITKDGVSMSATLLIPEKTDQLKTFVNLRDRTSHTDVPFGKDSVVVTEKLASQLGIRPGDSIQVKVGDDAAAAFRVSGITENYVYHYVYVDPALYESKTGNAPEYNEIETILPKGVTEAPDSLKSKIMAQEGVGTFTMTHELTDRYGNMIQSVNLVVIVLIVSAGLLAFIVLYNLTNINVTERQRELATIKVLGFFDREVSAYIYRETFLLTVIGCIVGLGFGIFMHSYVVLTTEVDFIMFGRSIEPLSFIWSAGLTLLFSGIVNLVMYRKLKKIDMVESLKSVD